MIIKLFDTNEKKFNNNGLGNIQPLKCIETKKKSLNGWYVEVELPIKYFGMIKQDMIILVKTKEKGAQPFRIGNITKQNRKISFTANHVAFDTERYFLLDVRPTNLSMDGYLKWLNARTDKTSPFSFSSNVADVGTNYFIRKTLLEALTEVDKNYNGVFDFDNFSIKFLQKVGNDNGFSIIYGKNLQSIKAIEDWSNVVTKLYPEGPDGIMLPEVYIESDTQYEQPYTRTIKFDFEASKEDEDGNSVDLSLEEQYTILRQMAKEHIETNKEPLINYTIESDVNQDLCIGDIIHLKHPFIDLKTEVQEYTYNVLSQRVETLTFGNYERDVKKVFDSIKGAIEENKQNNSKLTDLINNQTDLINKLNKEGYVYIDKNEILILDKLPRENAKQVWRFGLGGIGFSNNGYKGPFNYAFTQDGKFNTDFIQAKSITVNHLQADIGSALDISSNDAIKFVVSNYNTLSSDLSSITDRVDTAEINLKPSNILMAVNSQIKDGSSISGTTFEIDKDGVHITGGGLDISSGGFLNKKLFYADTNGNLNIVNLIATNANISGTITGSTITGSTIKFLSSDGTTNYIIINDYGIEIDGQNAPINFGTKGGWFQLSTVGGFLLNNTSPIQYRPNRSSNEIWYAAFVNGCNRFRWVSNLMGTSYLELQTLFGAYGLSAFQSDISLKTNIFDSEVQATEIIKAIRHRQFDWISSGYHNDCGYIAQELMQLNESFVLGIDQEDGSTKYQVNETTLLPVISKAVQELIDRVENLERKLENYGAYN